MSCNLLARRKAKICGAVDGEREFMLRRLPKAAEYTHLYSQRLFAQAQ